MEIFNDWCVWFIAVFVHIFNSHNGYAHKLKKKHTLSRLLDFLSAHVYSCLFCWASKMEVCTNILKFWETTTRGKRKKRKTRSRAIVSQVGLCILCFIVQSFKLASIFITLGRCGSCYLLLCEWAWHTASFTYMLWNPSPGRIAPCFLQIVYIWRK